LSDAQTEEQLSNILHYFACKFTSAIYNCITYYHVLIQTLTFFYQYTLTAADTKIDTTQIGSQKTGIFIIK